MTKRKDPPVPVEGGPMVYCGPDLPGIARQYTVYRNGLPAPLAEAAENHPAPRGLIVPLDRLPEARRAISEKSGHIYRLFRLVQAKKEA